MYGGDSVLPTRSPPPRASPVAAYFPRSPSRDTLRYTLSKPQPVLTARNAGLFLCGCLALLGAYVVLLVGLRIHSETLQSAAGVAASLAARAPDAAAARSGGGGGGDFKMAAARVKAGGKAAVIFLHGLGDAGSSWSWMAPQYGKALELFMGAGSSVEFSFPDAPVQPVSLNEGEPMPSWFDLDALPVTAATPHDDEGFNRSSELVHRLIDAAVAAGAHPSRIVLGGFSQGAALSLYAGLRYKQPLGGLILLSGWATAAQPVLPVAAVKAAAKPRVYCAHGWRDDKVDFDAGSTAAKLLQGSGFDVLWREHDGYHELVDDEVRDIASFLTSVLGAG
jgi:phospholipase/carboxylesterase